MRCPKWLKTVLLSITVLFVGIQFVPIERTNPPITGEIQAHAEVMRILRKACYDCHSNETSWPWYSYIAPMSWTIESDVKVGRGDLNFSEWSDYSPMKQDFKQSQSGELVAAGEMPLWFYIPLHPEADLTKEEIELIVAWGKEAE